MENYIFILVFAILYFLTVFLCFYFTIKSFEERIEKLENQVTKLKNK